MKRLKIFLLVLGALALLLAVGVGLALTPAVQTWAVRRALAGQPGATIEIGRVAAGFSDAQLADVRLAQDQMVVTAKGVSVQYSAWDYLMRRAINADQLKVEELVVDLRGTPQASREPAGGVAPAAAPAAAQPPAARPPAAQTAGQAKSTPAARGTASAKPAAKPIDFSGVLKSAQLPVELRLGTFTAKGRVLLPANQTSAFDVRAANVGSGQSAKIEWSADFTDTQKGARLRKLASTGSLTVRITADRRIDRVEVDGVVNLEGQGLPKDRIKLAARVEQATPGGNESYALQAALLRANTVVPLVTTSAQYEAARREIAGSWELTVPGDQLAAAIGDATLPELSAGGKGKFSFSPGRQAFAASGEMQGQLSKLDKLSPNLAALGGLRFKGVFDSGVADETARLDRLELEISGADGRTFAQLNLLQKVAFSLAEGRVTLANPQAELARLALKSAPLAWLQGFAGPFQIASGDVSLAMAIAAEADGSRIRVRTPEPIVLHALTVKDGTQTLVDRLELATRLSVDYAANRVVSELAELNVSMPAGDNLAGKFTAEIIPLTPAPVVTFSTQLRARWVAALKSFMPFDPGPLTVAVDAEGRADDQKLQLRKASIDAKRATGAPLATLDILQPLTADFRSNSVAVANPAALAARIGLGELPLAWAEAFVPKSKFGGVVAGGTLELTLRSVDDLSVKTAAPCTLRGIDVALDGKAQVQALDVAADFTAAKRGAIVSAEVRRLDLRQGDAVLAGFSGSGQATLGKKISLSAKGTLEADAASLMKQPALAPFATLARGKISTAFEANVGDTVQAKATAAARNLVAKQDNLALGDLDFSVVLNLKADGSGTVTLPLTLTRAGRKSDLGIEGTFGRTAKAFLFTGRIASNQLSSDDLQPLAGLAPSSPPTPSTPAARPSTPTPARGAPDAQPAWNGINGKLELDLKKVIYGRDYVIGGIRGTAVVTDTRLAVENLEGRFKENPFKLTGGITFAAGQAQPYALLGNANVSNLDLGEILRAANPGEKPAIESKVTVAAKVAGNGGTLPNVLESLRGQFDLKGSSGVLRALGRKGEAVGALSTIVGLIGAARGSNTTVAASELAAELNEMRFDNFTLRVDRGTDLTLKLSALEFVSPSTRVTGTGSITSQPRLAIENQPLSVQMKIAGKQHMATILNRAGLLDGKQDDKGYYTMNTAFEIRGTPANPDSKDLWRIIGEATTRALLR